MSEESIQRLRQTMIKKHGSLAAWKKHMHEIAIKGGKNSKGGGFKSRRRAKKAGRLGGMAKQRNRLLKDKGE